MKIMIRHILIIPVILLSVNLLVAQPTGVKYNIGPKAALNVYKSRFNFKEDEEIFDQNHLRFRPGEIPNHHEPLVIRCHIVLLEIWHRMETLKGKQLLTFAFDERRAGLHREPEPSQAIGLVAIKSAAVS